jgi:hypothetical protein
MGVSGVETVGGQPARPRGAPRRTAAALALVVLAALPGLACGGGGSGGGAGDEGGDEIGSAAGEAAGDAAPDEASSEATTTTSAPGTDPLAQCPQRPAGSSPAEFEASTGTYAALLIAVDAVDPAAPSLDFDVVQWLTGEDAAEAYRAANPDDPSGTPPNDYWLVNENPLVRSAPLASGAAVHLSASRTAGDPTLSAATVEELAAFVPDAAAGVPGDVFWLTFSAGQVTDVCFQFRP